MICSSTGKAIPAQGPISTSSQGDAKPAAYNARRAAEVAKIW